MMERSIIRIPVYIAFGLAAFFIALLLTFPSERIKEIATVQIEKQLKGEYDVSIEKLGLWWLSGIKLKNVQLVERVEDTSEADDKSEDEDSEREEEEPTTITIPRIAGGIAPVMSAFHLAPTFDFRVDLGGGDVRGNFIQGKKKRELNLKLNFLTLRDIDLFESLLGVPLAGQLKGNIDLELHPRQPLVTGGEVRLRGDNLLVQKTTLETDKLGPMGFIDIPETDFGQLDAHLVIEPEPNGLLSKMRFKDFRIHEGEDVRGEVWGDLTLGRNAAQGSARLEMRFQFDERYIRTRNLGDMLQMGYFREGKNKDWYGFMLWGRLNAPRFKGSPAAAEGPENTDDAAEETKEEAPKEEES